MQPVVLEQELLLHTGRVLRIAYRLVKVHHTVQHLRRANPLVDSGATFFVVFRIIAVAFERGDGTTEDVDASLVGLTDNLLIDVDDALGCLHTVLCTAQVVDGLKQDNPAYTLLP